MKLDAASVDGHWALLENKNPIFVCAGQEGNNK